MTLAVAIQSANILPRRMARYHCPLDPEHLNLNVQSNPARNADIIIYGTYQLSLLGICLLIVFASNPIYCIGKSDQTAPLIGRAGRQLNETEPVPKFH
jgi:hypothetical protein